MQTLLFRLRNFFATQRSGSEGSAIVEFALAFPLQLAITFGILQMILLMISGLMVNYAAVRACRAAVVDEDPTVAAKMVLSPLAGRSIGGDGQNIEVDGWGEITGSGTAEDKLSVEVDGDASSDTITTTVIFEQELIFPFIDALLKLAMGQSNQSPSFGGHDEASGRIRVHNGNRIHVIIRRSHTMAKQPGIEVGPESDAYIYRW